MTLYGFNGVCSSNLSVSFPTSLLVSTSFVLLQFHMTLQLVVDLFCINRVRVENYVNYNSK